MPVVLVRGLVRPHAILPLHGQTTRALTLGLPSVTRVNNLCRKYTVGSMGHCKRIGESMTIHQLTGGVTDAHTPRRCLASPDR
jgi:hypothetical protein